MEKYPFQIEKLNIRKVPGFPDGLAPYEDLSPQINIIAGPNASGKSTTAQAIQKLIWPNRTEGLQIAGHIHIDDEVWNIRIDSNRSNVQRNGKDAELNGLPAAEDQDRYMLALHTLISDSEEDLAERIIQESIGGFDLDKAKDDLGYSDHIKPRSVGEYKEYKNARQQVKDLKEKQKELKEDQKSLANLYKDKEKAQEAAKLKELYGKVVDYLEVKQAFIQQKDHFKDFPKVLEKANGDEYDRLNKLEEDITDAGNDVKKAKDKIKKEQDVLNELDIPESGVDNQDITELEERVERLQSLEEEIIDIKSNQKEQEQQRRDALTRIDENVEATDWNGLNLEDIRDLEQFLQKAHQTASAKHFLEKVIEALEEDRVVVEHGRQTLQNGINSLSQWLKEPKKDSEFPKWILPVIGVAAVVTFGISFMWFEAAWVGLVIIVALVGYGLFKSKQEGEQSNMEVREEDFSQTGLISPSEWTSDGVSQRLEELIEQLQAASRQEKLQQQINQRKDQIEELKQNVKQVKETEDKLREKLSALPKLPFGEPQSYSELYWFITHVQKWQKHDEKVRALKEAHAVKQNTFNEKLETFNELGRKYIDDTAEDVAQGKAIFKKIKSESDAQEKTANTMSTQEEFVEDKNETIDEFKSEQKEIHEKLDIEKGNKEKVQHLLTELEDFKEAKQEFHTAESRLSDKKMEMKEHSKYHDEQSKIEALTLDQAKDEVNKFEDTAKNLEKINSDITAIETNIKNAEGDNSLENALKEKDDALLELKELYDKNLSSITGQLLVDQLKDELKEQNRPNVFKKANKLFNRITKGQYKIEIDKKNKPAFIAYDTVKRVGKKLHELSTGTRIQLLLSVRLAFVETQESAIKLPILADELLANSDDMRAQAIIEALTEISKDGRQVFYFTAQADEVNKWKASLAKSDDIDYKVYKLPSNGTSNEVTYDTQQVASIELLHEVPKPDGLSYEEYGEEIDPGSYNLKSDKPTELHLWYLFEDGKLLYKCLAKDINRWGQLKSFLESNGNIEGLADSMLTALKEKVKLLKQYQTLFQQGRPKVIDRSILENSGAVSNSFIDEVSQKLKELDGNPELLLGALRNSEVSGFRSNKIEQLKNDFLDKGFIDQRTRLDRKDIESNIQAFISNLEITLKQADTFLKRIAGNHG